MIGAAADAAAEHVLHVTLRLVASLTAWMLLQQVQGQQCTTAQRVPACCLVPILLADLGLLLQVSGSRAQGRGRQHSGQQHKVELHCVHTCECYSFSSS